MTEDQIAIIKQIRIIDRWDPKWTRTPGSFGRTVNAAMAEGIDLVVRDVPTLDRLRNELDTKEPILWQP